MLFNSAEFLLFLPLVFAVYWAMNRWTQLRGGLKAQNLLLLAASYVFYGWWDWRFLSLIAFSTAVDYAVGLKIKQANARELATDAPTAARSRTAKRWLRVSIAVNLGLLAYFKYANFFIESWVDVWSAVGVTLHASTLQIILPVGISFYTFQTLSYTIDIYRRRLEPTQDFIAFASFVGFFPQLVAGPIERASALLPQIQHRRTFDYDQAVSGIRLILWGMFKKVVVADTCAIYVNDVFANYEQYSGPTLILGSVFFAFQIYGDFSGYSDIAIGTARLFGIRLMTNFKTPYFARDIAEFWRRWHISLTSWFRDYIFVPLGGARGRWKSVRNTFILFLASGLWHGANWTFVAMGAFHALLFVPLLLSKNRRRFKGDIQGIPSLRELAGMAWTFSSLTFTWFFFRSPSIAEALNYLSHLIHWEGIAHYPPTRFSAHIALLLAAEWIGQSAATHPPQLHKWGMRIGLAVICLLTFRWFGTSHEDFIYFQF